MALPADIKKSLSKCQSDGKSDTEVISSALDQSKALKILTNAADGFDCKFSMPELDQRLKIICQMVGGDFSEDKATACAKALFVDQSKDSLDAAFKCFAKDDETHLSLDEFKELMPLMVENFPQEKLDALVKEVDADGSGNIDSNEFGRLILGLSGKQPFSSFGLNMFNKMSFEMPKMEMPQISSITMPWSKTEEAQTAGEAKTEEEKGEDGEEKKEEETKEEEKTNSASWLDPGESMSGFMSAYNADLPALGPLEMVKVGKVMNRMTFAGYSPEKAQIVCKVLFCPVEEEDMKKVFDLFDVEGDGVLSAEEFTQMMPLLGEEMTDEKIAETLVKVDKDKSGKLEFNEFSLLLNLLNPKQGPAPLKIGDQVKVLGGVTFQKGKKVLYKEGDLGEVTSAFGWGDDVTLEIKWNSSGKTTQTKLSQTKEKFEKVKITGAEKAGA